MATGIVWPPTVKDAFAPQQYARFEISTDDDRWVLFGKARMVEVNNEYPDPVFGDDFSIYPGATKTTVTLEVVPEGNVSYTLKDRKGEKYTKHFPREPIRGL